MIKYIKLLGLVLGIVAVNVLAFSPGFIGLNFGEAHSQLRYPLPFCSAVQWHSYMEVTPCCSDNR